MKRFQEQNRFQKGVLLVLLALVLGFTAAYGVTASRVGFAYQNTILIPRMENGNQVYAGTIQGQDAAFTVYADETVAFRWGDRLYGPYRVTEDPSAIPESSALARDMTGIELRRGEELLFRGGVVRLDGGYWLWDEAGQSSDLHLSVITGTGVKLDMDGNEIDPLEPSVSVILTLLDGPELTAGAQWGFWVCGVLICAVTALSILFAQELFHLRLALLVRDAYGAEPSEWELAGRYIAWTSCSLAALALFCMGLRPV